MLFNSNEFVVFFCAVFVLVLVLNKQVWARNLFLLVASYFFYASWDWRFLGLILISTIVDYICGLALNTSHLQHNGTRIRVRQRRAILLVSLFTNLGILGFFKYYDFFITSAVEALATIGIQAHANVLGIILPVGISFYTFQTLSYTIDVYRGRIPTERNLLNFSLFVAFFPQLVAGPIERASSLLPQMRRSGSITLEGIYSGFWLICWGMFKKVVIADNIAPVVDMVFAEPSPSSTMVLIGIYGFAIQIYCDFSGYTDIARGVARCLGFNLMLNFNLPYFATNPSDFWRRWHISLSTWLRDYLYIPLGGNRLGTKRTYINLMLTMVLGGLWHGAAWTFLAWGAYQGTLLCIHRAMEPWLARVVSPKNRAAQGLWYLVRVVLFFQLVCIGWLFFRAESLSQVGVFLNNLLLGGGEPQQSLPTDQVVLFIALSLLLLLFQLFQFLMRDLDAIFRLPVPVRAGAYAGLALVFIWFGAPGGTAFIYFQF